MMNLHLNIIHYTKISSKWVIDLKLKHKTMKLLEISIKENFCDLELNLGFWAAAPLTFLAWQFFVREMLLCVVGYLGFPGGASSKEATCKCRRHKRHGLDPRFWKIPWRRAWQPTLVFLPGVSPWTEEPGGLHSMGLQRVGHDWATKHTCTWDI